MAMKMPKYVDPHNHFDTEYSGKHTFIIKGVLHLYFFHIHIKMPNFMKVTMAVTVIQVSDIAISVINASGGSVKICCSGVKCV